ncbi:hypothetical protein BZG02_04485 [Labilibaculum filiforme]|uniref:Uncharacterized protein n=1 Tax=Labilibaculum filiforme TaxID=1940526 RepID=A0A2N3I467_9BACT|nr:hypothetical protein [Labilibaculum filiforme]PKQ65092.1 hypothetical protein BZG02_04485 [Labilibaculum filiforme]
MKVVLTVFLIFLSFFGFGQDFDSELNKANSKFFEENYTEALISYQELIATGIGDTIQRSWAFGYVGVCQQERGKMEEAKKNYRIAIGMGTPGPSFYSKLLAIYKSENDTDGQEFVLLTKSKNLPHEYRESVKSLAYLYVNTGKFKELIPLCDELLVWDSGNYKYHYFKAIAYQKLEDVENAVLEYRKAIDCKSDDVNSNMNLGVILFLEANRAYDTAVEKYEAIVKPTDNDYQKCIKNLDVARADMRKAEPFLLVAYKLKPNNNVKNALYNLYKKCNEHEKVKDYQ